MIKGIVTGNIGADAEIRQFKSGHEYVSFIVAHDKGRDNPTVWVRVSWIGGVDSPVLKYLKKGAKVTVVGDLSVSSYTDKNGNPAAGIDLYADSVDMVLFAKREEAQAPGLQAGTAGRYGSGASASGSAVDDMPDFTGRSYPMRM